MTNVPNKPDFSTETLRRVMREENTVIITEYRLDDVSPYIEGENPLFIPGDDPSSTVLADYARQQGIAYYLADNAAYLALMPVDAKDVPQHVATMALLDDAERLIAVHRESPDEKIRCIIAYAVKTGKPFEEYIVK